MEKRHGIGSLHQRRWIKSPIAEANFASRDDVCRLSTEARIGWHCWIDQEARTTNSVLNTNIKQAVNACCIESPCIVMTISAWPRFLAQKQLPALLRFKRRKSEPRNIELDGRAE